MVYDPDWADNRHSYCRHCQQPTVAPYHEELDVFYCVFCGHCIHHPHDGQVVQVAQLQSDGMLVGHTANKGGI